MRLAALSRFLPSLALVAGCGAPYTHAAATYADASTATTDAVSTTRGTAADLCLKKARLRYLDGRLKEDAKVLPWGEFFTARGNATATLSWGEYCQQIDKTAELFGLGVAALAEYATALAALAKTGEYDGANLKAMGEKATGMATALGAAEGPAAAIQPIGNMIAGMSSLLFHAVAERKLKAYVIAAEPVVQSLLAAMGAYVRALGTTLATTDDVRAAVIKRAEKGMVTGAAPMDPARVVQFVQLAGQLDDDGRHAKDTLEGYASVLKKMAEAHTTLAKASADGATDDDAKNVLGVVADLLEQIKALRVALAK